MKENSKSEAVAPTVNPHHKIIKKVCAELLLPMGVFQKGASRTYIDDNGYFFTVIEFQPSAWSKGTFLNVSLHFLWKEQPFLSFDYPINPRVKDFIPYQTDEQFETAMREYALQAQSLVLSYRKLRDLKYAKKFFMKYLRKYRNNRQIQHLAAIQSITDEEILQAIQRTRNFWRAKSAFRKLPKNPIFDK